MPKELDERIISAIENAAADCNQNKQVAEFIKSWFTNLLSGNTDFDDKDDTKRNIDLLISAVEDNNKS